MNEGWAFLVCYLAKGFDGSASNMKTKLTIRNCETTFRFQCPKIWSELNPTPSAQVRHCTVCDCDVFFCNSDEETIVHAKAGHCIARELPDEKELPLVYLGRPKNPQVPTPEQKRARDWSMRERGIDDSIQNADADRSCPKCNYPAPRWRETCRVRGFKMGRALSE
jgi:hypothetical protein